MVTRRRSSGLQHVSLFFHYLRPHICHAIDGETGETVNFVDSNVLMRFHARIHMSISSHYSSIFYIALDTYQCINAPAIFFVLLPFSHHLVLPTYFK